MSNNIVNKWNEIKLLVESLELDVHKNANGNASAGVRSRRGLRQLKSEVSSLVKLTLEEEKARRS